MCDTTLDLSKRVCYHTRMIYSDLAKKLRRAALHGSRLHLEPSHVAAILSSPLYAIIANLEAEELSALCPQNEKLPLTDRQVAPRSARSGSGIEPIEMTGTYAGTSPVAETDVGHAASRLASVAAAQVVRRGKQLMH